jgi:hypothetical protein
MLLPFISTPSIYAHHVVRQFHCRTWLTAGVALQSCKTKTERLTNVGVELQPEAYECYGAEGAIPI